MLRIHPGATLSHASRMTLPRCAQGVPFGSLDRVREAMSEIPVSSSKPTLAQVSGRFWASFGIGGEPAPLDGSIAHFLAKICIPE